MGDPKGFLKIKRQVSISRPVRERIKDYYGVCVLPETEHSQQQASRCMDCGTPFCHWGCPLGNYIPEWNDLIFHGHWERAFQLLDAANNLPEITGRVCPNLCEYSCVLGINDDPVTIRENELALIEYAFKQGWVKSNTPLKRTGKKIAVVGSGPAGLSCAAQLNKAGHRVAVFERDDKIGGILRYGIPDFKLEKWILDRRLNVWKEAGIEFMTNVNAGVDYPAAKLLKEFDAICLAGGSRVPRNLNIEGRDLNGIHFAMDYLIQANRRIAGEVIPDDRLIDAKGKRVVVIGGGDTGADCLGVAHRQGADCVVQIELLPRPSECRTPDSPWPRYPVILKTSTSHEEGGERQWSVLTKKFSGENSRVKRLFCVKVKFDKDAQGCLIIKEIPGSEFEIAADLVILALGFMHPEKKGLIEELNLELDSRANVQTNANFMASVISRAKKNKAGVNKVFACGDMRRGQSLVVWAIAEGRESAYHIDRHLMGAISSR